MYSLSSPSIGRASSTGQVDSKLDLTTEAMFRWDSIKTFVYLGDTFASTLVNFEMFSITRTGAPLAIFILVSALIGVPYMFIDFFIRQYTGKVSFNENLNPLLKAVNYGVVIETIMRVVLQSVDLSHTIMYFVATFSTVPNYFECPKDLADVCVQGLNSSYMCGSGRPFVKMTQTSNHFTLQRILTAEDRNSFTTTLLLIGISWLLNFFLCTLSENLIVKIFKISFIFRLVTTVLLFVFFMLFYMEDFGPAFTDVMSINQTEFVFELVKRSSGYTRAIYLALPIYGLGIIGVYDFGTMSPFANVDTAVVLFAVVFITKSIIRSVNVRTMYKRLSRCVRLAPKYDHADLIFSLLPLSTTMWPTTRIYLYYIFLNMLLTLIPHITAQTYTTAKMLQSEFKKIKLLYLSALVNFAGCITTVFFFWTCKIIWKGVYMGVLVSMLFLAFFRILIIMYVYGVERFANDVKFWLGMTPSNYWIVTWSLLPLWLLGMFTAEIMRTLNLRWDFSNAKSRGFILSRGMFISCMGIVAVIAVKIIGKHIGDNTLVSLLKQSYKYGPADNETRKRRKNFDEAITRHSCSHNCTPLDDRLDCSHVVQQLNRLPPMMQNMSASWTSEDDDVKDIFQTKEKPRKSDIYDVK